MKRKKTLLHLLLFMFAAAFVLAGRMPVQAAKTRASSITLDKSVYTLKKGKSVKLKAAVKKGAKKRTVEWSSSNKKIASVSRNGKVTAKKNGRAKITARIKGTGKKASCRIIVGTPVKSMKLKQTAVTLNTGGRFTLKATVSPKKATTKKVTYKSSNSKVASVSGKGVIRAIAAGTAKITVSAADGSGKKAVCTVTVAESDIPVTGVTLNRNRLDLKQGETAVLTAAVLPANATDKNIRWESSNPEIARVSANGTVQAVSAGTAVIMAASVNHKKAECTVVVKAETIPEDPSETTPEGPSETDPKDPSEQGNILVAYFSWSGTSERIAQNIIEQTGADSFRIERETPYSDDYNTVAYGEAKDEAEANARPPLKDPLESIAQYDRIILCYPIWWHTAPMTVGTFLESYDMSGKYIYPVSQSASMDRSQYEQSVEFIKECAKGAVVDDGIFSKDNAAILAYIEENVM